MNTICKPLRLLYCLAIISCGYSGVCTADDCKPVSREKSIQDVLNANAGSKVLKVEEQKDDNGCPQLIIRILVDGTVKAITVK